MGQSYLKESLFWNTILSIQKKWFKFSLDYFKWDRYTEKNIIVNFIYLKVSSYLYAERRGHGKQSNLLSINSYLFFGGKLQISKEITIFKVNVIQGVPKSLALFEIQQNVK